MENTKHTREQIVESIVAWSKAMIDNGMLSESEARQLLGEGLFKRAVGAVKRAA